MNCSRNRAGQAEYRIGPRRSHAGRGNGSRSPGWRVCGCRNALEHRRYAEALEFLEPALEQVDKTPRRPLADLRLLTAEALVHVDRLSEAEYLFLEELETIAG